MEVGLGTMIALPLHIDKLYEALQTTAVLEHPTVNKESQEICPLHSSKWLPLLGRCSFL